MLLPKLEWLAWSPRTRSKRSLGGKLDRCRETWVYALAGTLVNSLCTISRVPITQVHIYRSLITSENHVPVVVG